MREPIPTMPGLHDPPRTLRGAAESDAGPRRDSPNALLHQRPRGLNRIEIVRVRRQEPQGGAGLLDQCADLPRFVGGQIVHDDHVPTAQVRYELPTHPRDEPLGGHRVPRGRERQPPIHADRADERQIVAPVPGPWFNQLGPAGQPGVRPSHREIRAGFIEKHQPPRVYPLRPAAERLAVGLDAGLILFHRARAFFLNTYPVRCNARNTLDRCTRAAGTASRLYARVNSSVVRAGRVCTKRCKSGRSIGEGHPPPLSNGAISPVSRARWTHRTRVARLTPNVAATSLYRSAPPSYARTARSRRAVGYGLGMHAIDHNSILNSSELWG